MFPSGKAVNLTNGKVNGPPTTLKPGEAARIEIAFELPKRAGNKVSK